MKLLPFHEPDGKVVWISPAAIVRIRVDANGQTMIDFGGEFQFVTETPEQVLKALNEGQ